VDNGSKMRKPVKYDSYLLRMWQVPTDEDHNCRILLESIPAGEKWSFGNLEELIVYLRGVQASDQVTLNEKNHS
jgi:hypothetical protein